MLISGEPGIGKSRLAAALEERLARRAASPPALFLLAASPGQRALPVHRPARHGRPGSRATIRPRPSWTSSRPCSPAPRRPTRTWRSSPICCRCRRRSATRCRTSARSARRSGPWRRCSGSSRVWRAQQPVLMVFEDAHWIDPTSRELLDLIVERVAQPAGAADRDLPPRVPAALDRPAAGHDAGAQSPRPARPDRSGRADRRRQGLARRGRRPDRRAHRRRAAVRRGTDQERAWRAVCCARRRTATCSTGALPPFAIPTTLHASLLARLDRLASVRHVAQIGAAIGREFSYALLRAVSRLPEDELQAALARLVASELVFQRGTPPDAVYRFKHALVQDAAHGSLLRRCPAAIARADRRSARNPFPGAHGQPARALRAALRRSRAR